ncbi:hypothetical protein [Natrialba asiatica]|uniref:Uncharacterized protein n=1 Tax=Natrialba asiatica (strain ATCC 700177 / DSM 12278 / JCM 9576 / FERM P-10747 / NBRC 102637 / 172P1) TaxID=29540 RepID=M0AWJ3_NATA1|nr:hypothetical protein [Natrialba asiatica]ELZ01779.1 hypothetical protein C481_09672 [Natrialba asiatica DSM 12278]
MTLTFKPVPEPPADRDALTAVRNAVPATKAAAAETADCCVRVLERTGRDADGTELIRDRDDAATWLTFLRALELATDGEDGYRRTDRELEREAVQAAFRNRVDGVQSIFEALDAAAEPLSAATVADRVRSQSRSQSSSRRRVQPDRVERLLEWAVLLGLAERRDRADEIEYRAIATPS